MIVDTSGLFCCFDEGDARHDDAVTFFQSAHIRLAVVHEVTTERSEHSYVLAEFVALCQSRGLNRIRVLDFSADLFLNPHVEVVWVDETLHRSASRLAGNGWTKPLG